LKRSLLRWIPAASALLAYRETGEIVVNPPFTPAGFSICVQCWSWKEFTLFEAIEMAAAAGAGGVELFPGQKLGSDHGETKLGPEMDADSLRAVIDHLAKNHIAAVNFGVVEIPNDEAAARQIFDFAKSLGLYGITTESLGSLDLLEKLAAEYDLRVCFHNHPKPSALWRPETISAAIAGRHEHLGFCADIGHWASSGLDPLEVTREIAPRVRSFHIKDRASLTEWSRDQPLGTGTMPIAATLAEVRRHGFAGNVSIEYEANWHSNLPEIAQCVGFLRALSAVE
jgi:sugar phosphate isomerase/epimerase